jgi:hypothetical protein
MRVDLDCGKDMMATMIIDTRVRKTADQAVSQRMIFAIVWGENVRDSSFERLIADAGLLGTDMQSLRC